MDGGEYTANDTVFDIEDNRKQQQSMKSTHKRTYHTHGQSSMNHHHSYDDDDDDDYDSNAHYSHFNKGVNGNHQGKGNKMSMQYYKNQIRRYVSLVMSNKDSKRILIFLSLNFSFMFVEIFVGYWTNSLGLISDAGHMFFDCGSLFLGLFATVVSRLKTSDHNYSYGYSRFEVLAGFVNGIFLIFVAGFVFLESIERISIPHDMKTDGLLLTSISGFVVNIIGLVYFHDHAHSHGGSSGNKACDGSHQHGHSHGNHHGHSHGSNQNMHGVYLHILADALGSGGVIVSSLLVEYKGLTIADPICSFCISILIFARFVLFFIFLLYYHYLNLRYLSAIPLLSDTAETLMNMIPNDKYEEFEDCLAKVHKNIEVVQIRDPHLWLLSSNIYIASVTVVVKDEGTTDIQVLSRWIAGLLREIGVTYPTVQVCKASTMSSLLHERKASSISANLDASIWVPRKVPTVYRDQLAHPHESHGHSHNLQGSHGHSHNSNESCSHSHGSHDSHGHSHNSHGHSHDSHDSHSHSHGSEKSHGHSHGDDNDSLV